MKKIILVILVILMLLGCASPPKIKESYSLKQLNLGNKIEGSFFLGCGGFGEELYYYGYYIKDDGAIIPFREHYSSVMIYETDTNFRYEKYNGYIEHFRYIKLYIPKNSIYQKYDVSLRKTKADE